MDLSQLITNANWVKTNYIKPHEYVLRIKYPELFQAIATRIKEEGYNAKFMGRTYHYVNVDGYKYWHFQLVLNRERLEP